MKKVLIASSLSLMMISSASMAAGYADLKSKTLTLTVKQPTTISDNSTVYTPDITAGDTNEVTLLDGSLSSKAGKVYVSAPEGVKNGYNEANKSWEIRPSTTPTVPNSGIIVRFDGVGAADPARNMVEGLPTYPVGDDGKFTVKAKLGSMAKAQQYSVKFEYAVWVE